MASPRFKTYLRTLRRSLGITQEELATLLALKSRAYVSKLERGEKLPSMQTAIACEVFFGKPCDEIFPQLYGVVRSHVQKELGQLITSSYRSGDVRDIRIRVRLERHLMRISN